MANGPVTLFLGGDVMLGRGVDQILPHPGDPALREGYVTDARAYVRLAEETHGPIPRPAGFAWPWGEALPELERLAPDVRVINLETSVTRSDAFAPGKVVHYRMNPANLPSLMAARPDVCVLANNHVLDFGRPGLMETIDALTGAGIGTAGAGRDLDEAWAPATTRLPGGNRVHVLACGMPSSGVPPAWAATADRSGVAYVPGPSDAVAAEIAGHVARIKRPGDVVVVSVHWGSNWGYEVGADQVAFARHLVEHGVDVVHGHSSHHPRPIEIHAGRLILYGCGDLIDDYEGISGYEEYRDDLHPLYLAAVDPGGGAPAGLRIVLLRARRMRLERAPADDVQWQRDVLDRVSRLFGTRIDPASDGTLVARRA